MASSKIQAMLVFTLMAMLGVSSAIVYKVEWNDQSVVDYETWASTKTFHVGDVILFKYDSKMENIIRVTHQNFRSCNATNPIAVMDSGADSVTIKSTHAHLFFISSVPGLCQTGQKVDIRVTQPTSHHSLAPIAAVSPSSSPAPAPDSGDAQSKGRASVAVELLMLGLGVLLY